MKNIKYAKNGQIYFESNDEILNNKVNNDIVQKLALDINTNNESYDNLYLLRVNRKLAYQEAVLTREVYRKRYKNDFSIKIKNYIQETWEEKDKNGCLRPYCGIVLYFKNQLIRPSYS